MSLPEKSPADVIEAKVASSTLVTLAASIGIAVLNGVLADSTLLGGLGAGDAAREAERHAWPDPIRTRTTAAMGSDLLRLDKA